MAHITVEAQDLLAVKQALVQARTALMDRMPVRASNQVEVALTTLDAVLEGAGI